MELRINEAEAEVVREIFRGWDPADHAPGSDARLHAITSRPVKVAEAKKVHRPRCPVMPRPDHLWRTRMRSERGTSAAATT